MSATGLHLARQLVVGHGGIMWTDPAAGRRHASLVLHPSSARRTARSPPRAACVASGTTPPLDLRRPGKYPRPRIGAGAKTPPRDRGCRQGAACAPASSAPAPTTELMLSASPTPFTW